VSAGVPGFRELLAADPEISSRLAADELGRCFDLGHHLRFSDEIVQRALNERVD